VNALNAVEVELIDEAIGRVLASIDRKGWAMTSTSSSRATTASSRATSVCSSRVLSRRRSDASTADLAPGALERARAERRARTRQPRLARGDVPEIAGEPRRRGRGRGLPIDDDDAKRRSFEATFTEWDSSIFGVDVHVRTVVTDDYLYTEYQPGTVHDGQ